jgi:hypothetical protein
MWRAQLGLRLPTRLRRRLWVLPDQAGIEATPQATAKAAAERK